MNYDMKGNCIKRDIDMCHSYLTIMTKTKQTKKYLLLLSFIICYNKNLLNNQS